MTSILYLDRESSKEARLVAKLTSVGFQVRAATGPSEAEKLVKYCWYDGMLVHCAKGEYAGIAGLCSAARGSVSLVMVLMDAPDLSFEAHLLDCGVDDVVVGTQACPQLITKRIKVRLRAMRSQGLPGARVRLGGGIADSDRKTVQRDGITYALSGILTDLLQYFVCNADHVISREELNESRIWADSICTPASEGGKTFDVHVGRLRKVIEGKSRTPSLIQSVRGVGWKLTARPVWDREGASTKSNRDFDNGQLLLFS